MLKGKTALVTGSTQGLGLATVERLASHGCDSAMNGLGNAQAIEPNRRRIAEAHGMCVLHHGADLSKPTEIASLVEVALAEFGGVDILVNNAGDRAAPCRLHGSGESAARGGGEGLHGLAPTVRPFRLARAGRGPGRLPVRAGRRQHHRLRHFRRRRLERSVVSAPTNVEETTSDR